MNGDLAITEIMYNPEDPREEESEDVYGFKKIVQNGSKFTMRPLSLCGLTTVMLVISIRIERW